MRLPLTACIASCGAIPCDCMDHLLLFVYIVMVTVSGAGIVAMLLLHLRLRTRVTRWFLVVISAFVASLFVGMLGFYLREVLLFAESRFGIFTVLGILFGIVVYGGIARIAIARGYSRWRVLIGVTFGLIVVQIVRAVVYRTNPGDITVPVHLAFIALISAWLFFAGFALRRTTTKADCAHDAESFLTRWFSTLLMVFAPVSVALYGLVDLIPVRARPLVSFDFMVAAGITLIVVATVIRDIGRGEVSSGSEEVAAEFIRRYGITPREKEIIEQVARGLSNQQIADELYVSLPTVRTHIYHVFQKTGVRNRVELLKLVHESGRGYSR